MMIRDLGYAGAQRQLVALANGLKAEGHDVTVICFYGGPLQADLEAANVRVVGLEKRHRWDVLGFFKRLVIGVIQARPQVFYSFLAESNLMAVLLKPLMRGAKIIWGLRDSETDSALYGWVGKTVFALGCKLSGVPDKIIANSYCGACYYSALGFPAENISVVHNGIDSGRFRPDSEARKRLRAELGVADDEVLFGLVGRLNPIKDHATFFKAAAMVRGKARFLCVGGGTGSYADSVRTMASELNLGSRLLWSEARGDMEAVFNALDVNVSSSTSEGFSNVVGEAMACGTPCVVTDVGDSAILVGDTGFTAPSQNPHALAAAMQRFMGLDADQRNDLKTSARRRIEECFNVPLMIENTSKVLDQVTDTGHRKPARVLFFITALGTGGAEMMLSQLISQLDRQRFTPVVVSLVPGGKYASVLVEAGVEVHDLGMLPGKTSLRSFGRLKALTRQIDPDLIVGWMYHGNLAASLAAWFGKKVPVLWNVRQSLYSLALEKRGSAAVIKALAVLDHQPRHILYNAQISAYQHEAIGYREDKTVIMPNGFNTELFKPDASARRSVFQELGLPPDAILVGRFGRRSAMKDYPNFVAAMASIEHQFPKVRAIIAGSGTEQLNNLPGNVIALGERHDLPRLTAALDVCCSSSAFGEGFPNVVAEAMSSAVPCVVTDVGDSAWLVGSAGQVVPARDSEALAKALADLISLPRHTREAIGQQGRQRIVKDFSLPSIVQQFETLLAAQLPF